MKRRAIFLDRDGTINEDVDYPSHFSRVPIFPWSFEAIRRVNRAGFLAIVVTNQSGVGRGLLDEDALLDIHRCMSESFAQNRAHLDAFYYCPHYDLSANPVYRKNCACRKPSPGMGHRAAADFGLDLSGSYMIGDKVEDIHFGYNLGAIPILVLTGFGKDSAIKLKESGREPAHTAQDLLHAVDWILEKEKAGPRQAIP